MAGNITLSAGVRANLMSLQNTASMMNDVQQRLSTGKKVNSAIDNPVNFFTAAGLQARAGDLSTLLDSVSNAVQTVNAASKGLDAITKLVESAKSVAKQALTTSQPAATSTLSVAGTAIAADSAAVGTGSVAFGADQAAVLTGTVGSITGASTLASLGIADGQTISISDGTNTVTHTVGTAATEDVNDLLTTLNGGAATWNVAINGSGQLEATSNNNTDTLTVSGNGAASAFGATTTASATNASITALTGILTVQQGTNAAVTADFGNITTRAGLLSALGSIASFDGSGHLVLTSSNTTDSIAVSGTGTSVTGTGLAASYDPQNSTLGSLNGTLTVQLGSGSAQTLTFGSGHIQNRAQLTTALSGLGITGLTANITSNAISFSSTNGESLTLGGTVLPALGLTSGTTAATTTVASPNATRTSLQNDYNALLTQISQLAADSSFNGVNLLNGDNLSVVFNENGSSSLSISGVTFNAAGLGLTAQSGTAFQVDSTLNSLISSLDSATTTLRSQASTFGSKLSVVQTRQDFTKNMINVLQIGADNLTLADTNQEGANLLALQTRQSLSTTALSMASQQDQSVLRLFQ